MKIRSHRVNIKSKPLFCGRYSRRIILIACSLLSFLLTACAPVIGNTQPSQTEWLTLGHGVTLGQTFVASFDGLSGIRIILAPHTPGTGKINIHLRSDAQSTQDIAVSSLAVSKVTAAGDYSFFFTPQSPSRRSYYYVSIDINGEGAVQVGAAGGDSYLDGARYENSIAQDGQLSFRLLYSIRRLGMGLLHEFAIWGFYLLAGIFLFLLPGWGLLKLLWPGWNSRPDGLSLTWMEKLGLTAGVSLTVYPILLLWTGLVGLRLGVLYAWIPPITGLVILIWNYRAFFLRRRSGGLTPTPPSIGRQRSFHLHIRWVTLPFPSIVLLIVVVLLIFTRFWAVRTLDAPMWGDSYQHTVITQLIVDHNGMFSSWQPYANLNTFTYHFGFHSAGAVFHWITGLAMPRAVLWTGQILNILAVLCLYPLAMKVCRNRWSGVTAVIVAGFLSPVPMSYANWGRYTQLAGQIVLVTVIYLLWSLTNRATSGEKTTITLSPARLATNVSSGTHDRLWRGIVLTAVVIGGLALTHFRVLVFALLFLAAIWLSSAFFPLRLLKWKSLTKISIWIGLGGGVIFLPWFINIFGGRILRNFTNQLTTPAGAVPSDMQSYNTVGNLLQYLPAGIWILLPLAAAWGLWKQHKGIGLISLWGFILLLAGNPAWLSLPGTGALSNFAIFIAIYIPASVVIGGAVGLFADEFLSGEWRADMSLKLANGWKADLLRLGVVGIRQKARLVRGVDGLIALTLIGLTLINLPSRLADLHPEQYALLTRPDLRAASWIRDHLSPEANLSVNTFFAYGGTLIVGSDGGWWLPVLAKRSTTLPPLNYGTESSSQPGYKQWINELSKVVVDKGISHPEVVSILRERHITHVYIGQRQGRVNYYGPAVFNPGQLVETSDFKVIYHQDRVWIFEVVQKP